MAAQKMLCLLRGVNVGGRKILMEELREKMNGMALQEVKTYIQSGNAVFTTPMSAADAKTAIEKMLRKEWGEPIPVWVGNLDDLQQMFAANPFSDPEIPGNRLHFTVAIDPLPKEAEETLHPFCQNGEEIRAGKNVLYFYAPNGYGRTKLTGNFIERKLKIATTSRNLNTMRKLRTMLEP